MYWVHLKDYLLRRRKLSIVVHYRINQLKHFDNQTGLHWRSLLRYDEHAPSRRQRYKFLFRKRNWRIRSFHEFPHSLEESQKVSRFIAIQVTCICVNIIWIRTSQAHYTSKYCRASPAPITEKSGVAGQTELLADFNALTRQFEKEGLFNVMFPL